MTKPTSEVKNRWNAKVYDRITFVVKKDGRVKERIKERAGELDMSVNSYLNFLVENDLNGVNTSQK